MIVLFVVSGIVLACGHRILSSVIVVETFPSKLRGVFGLFFFIWLLVLSVVCANRVFLWCCLAFFSLVIILTATAVVRQQRLRRFEFYSQEMISQLLLNMKCGHSFRTALQLSIDDAPYAYRKHLTEIRDHVVFLQQKPVLLAKISGEMLSELQKTDQTPHFSIQRLENYRELLRTRLDFRRKSGQALQQVRVQATFMLALYIAAALFACAQFGWAAVSSWLFSSAIPFFIGQLWLWRMGREFKWTV